MLNYCQIKNRDGRWVGCECVFTIVHDVMVGCTSIYRRGQSSQSKSYDLATLPQTMKPSTYHHEQSERPKLPSFDECFHHHHAIQDITCSLISPKNSKSPLVRSLMNQGRPCSSIVSLERLQLCTLQMVWLMPWGFLRTSSAVKASIIAFRRTASETPSSVWKAQKPTTPSLTYVSGFEIPGKMAKGIRMNG